MQVNTLTDKIKALLAAQHTAIIGQTGSGKTYGAKSVVEAILDRTGKVGIVDPTSAWWGLRSSKSGKSDGYPVTIFGGRHGDMPLVQESGAVLGDLIARDNVPAIFDVREFTVGERTRWFTDWASAVLRANTAPINIVLDEAHRFAPQARILDPQGGKMLHAAESMASGGRSLGLRLMLITQRPAKLHKDVLTCCSALVVFRVVAPQDRQAIEDWIDGCGDKAKGRQVLDSLASLPNGHAWIWIPQSDVLGVYKFPEIATFDSSATPKDGAEIQAPKTAKTIDLAALREKIGAVVKTAEANDPKALRRRIAELEAMKAPKVAAKEADPAAIERAIAKKYKAIVGPFVRTIKMMAGMMDAQAEKLGQMRETCEASDKKLMEWAAALEADATIPIASEPVKYESHPMRAGPATSAGDIKAPANPEGRAEIPKPQLAILDAIAWWNTIGIAPTNTQLAFRAGYSPKSSTWEEYVRRCRRAGLIVDERDRFSLTDAAKPIADRPASHADARELQAFVLAQLSGPSAKIVQALINAGENGVINENLAAECGYSKTSSSWEEYLRRVKRLELLEVHKAAYYAPLWLRCPEVAA